MWTPCWRRFRAATRLVFFANPNNPTGSMLPYQEVARLRAGLPEDVLLVLDAAYAEYVERPDYDPGVRLVKAGDNTVMTRTFSKIFGLGGMRIGWAYAPAGGGRCAEPGAGAVQRDPGVSGGGDRGLGGAGLGGEGPGAQPRIPGDLTRGLEAAGVKVWPSEGNFVLADFGTAERAKAADCVPAPARGDRRGRWGLTGCRTACAITVGNAEEVAAVIEALRDFMAQRPWLSRCFKSAGADRDRADRQLGGPDRPRARAIWPAKSWRTRGRRRRWIG